MMTVIVLVEGILLKALKQMAFAICLCYNTFKVFYFWRFYFGIAKSYIPSLLEISML